MNFCYIPHGTHLQHAPGIGGHRVHGYPDNFEPGENFLTSLVPSKPLTGDMLISIKTIFGLLSLAISAASSALLVSPITRKRGSLLRMYDHDSLINLWSSTRRMVIFSIRIVVNGDWIRFSNTNIKQFILSTG